MRVQAFQFSQFHGIHSLPQENIAISVYHCGDSGLNCCTILWAFVHNLLGMDSKWNFLRRTCLISELNTIGYSYIIFGVNLGRYAI